MLVLKWPGTQMKHSMKRYADVPHIRLPATYAATSGSPPATLAAVSDPCTAPSS